MFNYQLNAFELQFLVLAAERRNCGKQPNGVSNRKVDTKHSDFSINLHGLMGEFAVAKMLGIKVDTAVSLSGDDKVSDLTFNSKAIQVKTGICSNKNPRLYFRGHQLFQADVAVLATVSCATEVTVHGWITKSQFMERNKPWETSYGVVRAMNADELEQPEYLRSFLEG